MVITTLAELVQWELASLQHSWGTAVRKNWNSSECLNSLWEEIMLYLRQNGGSYLWRIDKTARSSLNSVATLPLFPSLMIVWLFYFLSHFNLLYLNLLNYSSYSARRACSAFILRSTSTSLSSVYALSIWGMRSKAKWSVQSLWFMALGSGIQAPVKTLAQRESQTKGLSWKYTPIGS